MIGIIVNPHARRASDPGLAARLRAQIAAHGAQERCLLQVTPDEAALSAALADFAARGALVVATCGGDGTVMATITGILRAFDPQRLPRLLILRGGTVNTIARNLRLRGRPEDLLAFVLAAPGGVSGVPVRPQDLICVRAEGQEERYGCLFAAAMGARFLQTYYQTPNPSLADAALLVARTVASTFVPGGGALARRLFADTEAALVIDGQKVRARHFRLLLCATVPDVGLGMRVTWQAGRAPGQFHVIASRLPILTMARQLPRVLAGRALVGPGSPQAESSADGDRQDMHLDRMAADLRLRFPAPQPYTLDGDLFTATEIHISAGPRLLVLCPPVR